MVDRMRDPESCFRSQYTGETVSWFDGLSRAGLERRQHRFKRLAQVIKQRRGCASCGYNKMASGLDFDHLPGHWKIFNLSSPPDILRLVEFKQEIAKCQLVISRREAEAQADVFFALRNLSEMKATTNENDLEYSRLCAAILAGAPPKPEKNKFCAW